MDHKHRVLLRAMVEVEVDLPAESLEEAMLRAAMVAPTEVPVGRGLRQGYPISNDDFAGFLRQAGSRWQVVCVGVWSDELNGYAVYFNADDPVEEE